MISMRFDSFEEPIQLTVDINNHINLGNNNFLNN